MGNFTVTLSCSHPSVEISQNTFAYHGMNPGESQMQNNAFTLRFGEALHDQEKVKFYLKMQNADHTFNDSLTLTVKAPKLKFGGLNITDLEGNETGRLVKGQSSYLTFSIENRGESKSMEINNKLFLMAPFLNIDEDEITIPAIEAGASGQVTFLAHVNEDAVNSIINYQLQAKSGYHSNNIESQIPIGYISEDFENETLNEDLQWNLGTGNKKWNIAEDTTAPGGHCLRSPSLSNMAYSQLHIGYRSDAAGTFSFYHKTSVGEDDMLILSVNGEEKATWSGISDWERSEFDLRPGSNLIRFTFKKNEGDNIGDNAVMIDELCFPPFAKMILYAGNDTNACSNATFTPEGYIYNQTDFAWSTNGDGSFDDVNAEHPTYTFGEADLEEGRVELTLAGTSALDGSQQSSTVAIDLLPSIDPTYAPQTPSGPAEVDLRLTIQNEYMAEEAEEVIYTWSLQPAEAGTVTGENHRAIVEWESDFRGQARIMYAYENPCGTTSMSEALMVNVFNSTGVNEQQCPSIEIYPNPANDVIHVKADLEGKATLRIIDMLGRTVYESKIQEAGGSSSASSGGTTIDTSKIGKAGLYTLQIIQNEAVSSVRFVILP